MILVDIRTEDDIYYALHCVRFLMRDVPFNESEKQSVSVTVLELARNIIQHGGANGTLRCELTEDKLQLTFTDTGSGISNPEEIMKGRYRSASGLGLGLAGAKRLMDEFTLESSTKGTIIHAAKRINGNRRRTST
ncbi:ATP-binding protein [Paenibacillus sp. GD4]|uniref:ATP-binding protein n=1 Tax=Paenibacillus sp. GD4 TaxID=3068890 RepID=UPI0027965A81|nr:ATP-binding protein [Paenibacillus sp. GD4]MDQ1910349.1 ATP-binding protein [Paenibacillus sp. GD4]